MRRGLHIAAVGIWLGVVLLAGVPAHAEHTSQDALDRIRAAYDAYDDWTTFEVKVQEESDFALTAQRGNQSIWQQSERDVTLTGQYDLINAQTPTISFTLSHYSTVSTGTDENGSSVTANVDVALVDSQRYWRGTYQAQPTTSFSLPNDWQTFNTRTVNSVAGLADDQLGSYLLDGGTDPFVGTPSTWLDAVQGAVQGPQTITIDRRTRTQGDLYTLTINPARVRSVLEDRVRLLIGEPDGGVDAQIVLDNFFSQGTVTWGVILDPDSGDLRGQYIKLELNVSVDTGDLPDYSSMRLQLADERNVLFSQVNESLDIQNLPDE